MVVQLRGWAKQCGLSHEAGWTVADEAHRPIMGELKGTAVTVATPDNTLVYY